MGNPDLDFQNLNLDFPIEHTLSLPSLTLIITYIRVLFGFKVEPRGFSCQAFIGFVIGLFISLWLTTGNSLESFGTAFVTLMVFKPERTCVMLIYVV